MTKVDTVAAVRPEIDQPVTTSSKKKEKKRKPYVKRACLSCHSAHVACEAERPCKRCKKKGIACVDYIPSKKKSSSESREDEEQTDGSDYENLEQEMNNNNMSSPRKKKKRNAESCVVRISAPSSVEEATTNKKEQQESSSQQQQETLYGSNGGLASSPSVLVKSALSQTSSERKRKTPKRKKDSMKSPPSSFKIEDVLLDEDSMTSSPTIVTSADPVSFDPLAKNDLTNSNNKQPSINSIPNNNIDIDNKSQMSMYQPYFWNQNPMMQQWFAMQMAQYQNQANNQQVQQPQQAGQNFVYPHPYFMVPIIPQQQANSFPVQTPTSPMQMDSNMSPSSAFPSVDQTYNPYAMSYNVPKPITMLENTDDGFALFDNTPTINDHRNVIEELDVNNNGLVEEYSNDGFINQEERPVQTVTTPPMNNNTTDNLAFFEDDDYFDTSENFHSNFADFGSSPQPTFQEPQEKKKPTQTAKKSTIDDEIIDLITSEASLLTEKSKEQNQQATTVSNNDSSSNTNATSDFDLGTDINYVISQAPDSMISKQTIGELIKRIWQTQENQTKEINELKQLVSELKRMIIS